jgi:hypothetical protein
LQKGEAGGMPEPIEMLPKLHLTEGFYYEMSLISKSLLTRFSKGEKS